MGDFTPVVAAVLAAIVGGLGTWFSARRLRKLGIGEDQRQIFATLRELADTWEEKCNIVTADLVAERASHETTRALLVDEQRAGDRCRRELDDVRSELRLEERRRRGRPA